MGEAAAAPAVAPWEAVVSVLVEKYAAGDWPTPPPVVTPALPERCEPSPVRAPVGTDRTPERILEHC